jgi:hypothetical protein
LLSIYGYEALGDDHNMYAMIEFDITDLWQRLRSQRKERKNVSFFSFLLSATARTIDENKNLTYRTYFVLDWDKGANQNRSK